MKNQKSLFVLSAIIVILLISLLTINFNKANAASSNESSNVSTACGNCKGYNKDTVFNQNVTFIKDAAIDYFTNERLPQTVNSKKKITLGEMINQKLVHTIVDSNGKSCSTTDSYVEVTKEKNEYTFKVNLSCSDVTDYIIVHKGCADYCGNSSCEVKVTPEETKTPETKEYEYEYRKTISCQMTNWSNWSNWSTNREIIDNPNYKKEEIKTETVIEKIKVETDTETKVTYNCDQYEGYELLGTVCVKTDSSILEEDADVNPTTYNCDKYGKEYKLEGTKCIKEEKSTLEEKADKNPTTYNCDKYGDGFVVKDNKCVKETEATDTQPATPNEPTYNCNKYGAGYTVKGNKCVKQTTVTDTQPATPNEPTYNCDKYGAGYTVKGNKCVKQTTVTDTQPATPNEPTYNCNKYGSGYNLVGSRCIKDTSYTDTFGATPNYDTRSVGYSCRKENCKTEQKLDCSTGSCVMKDEKVCTYYNGTCYRDEEYISGYSCPNGYTLSNTTCSKYIPRTDNQPATQNPTTYNCNKYGSEYKLSGDKCIKTTSGTDEKPATQNPTTYNCNKYGSEYKLSGDQCIKTTTGTDEKPAEENPTTYNCNKYGSDYKLNGKDCVKKYTDKEEKPAEENPATYNCDKYGKDYKLDGTNCVKEITTKDEKDAEENPTTYNCDKYEGYTLKGNKCLKAKCDVCAKEADKVEEEVCPEGYTKEGNVCTKMEDTEVEVTYYRYSTRSCVGGGTETKWSRSSNDTTLKSQGFYKTGNTRLLVITK